MISKPKTIGGPKGRKIDSQQIAYGIGDALGQIRLTRDHLQRRQREMALWTVVDTLIDYLEEYKGFDQGAFKQAIMTYADIGTSHETITHKEFLSKALGLPVE